jgi:hypothetical protein
MTRTDLSEIARGIPLAVTLLALAIVAIHRVLVTTTSRITEFRWQIALGVLEWSQPVEHDNFALHQPIGEVPHAQFIARVVVGAL